LKVEIDDWSPRLNFKRLGISSLCLEALHLASYSEVVEHDFHQVEIPELPLQPDHIGPRSHVLILCDYELAGELAEANEARERQATVQGRLVFYWAALGHRKFPGAKGEDDRRGSRVLHCEYHLTREISRHLYLI
jgi:hypothetical protein